MGFIETLNQKKSICNAAFVDAYCVIIFIGDTFSPAYIKKHTSELALDLKCVRTFDLLPAY